MICNDIRQKEYCFELTLFYFVIIRYLESMNIYFGNFPGHFSPSQIALHNVKQTQLKANKQYTHPSLQASQGLLSLEVNVDGLLKNKEKF